MKSRILSILLLLMLAVLAIKCKAPLSTGASSPSYVRLLDADPFVGSPIIRLSSDGNILVLYTATVPGEPVTSIELTEADANGNVLWTQHFGGEDDYQAGDVYPLANGTIAVAGTHTLLNNDGKFVFVLLDAIGNVLKDTEYGNLPKLAVTTIRQSSSGDLIVGGQSKSQLDSNDPNSQLVFLHLSSSGDFLGSDTLSFLQTAYIQYKLTEMSSISNNNAMGFGTYVPVQNATPVLAFYLWQAPDSIAYVPLIINNHPHTFRSIVRTGASTFIIAGDSADFRPLSFGPSDTPWIAQIAPPAIGSGMSVTPGWTRAIAVGSNASITSIIQTMDGGLAATGFSATQAGDTSIVVFRFKADGSDVWPYKLLGFSGGDVANTILELSNGDLIIGGVTTSFGSRASGAKQIFLLHLKSDGTPTS